MNSIFFTHGEIEDMSEALGMGKDRWRNRTGEGFSKGADTGSLDDLSELLEGGSSTNNLTLVCTPADILSLAQHEKSIVPKPWS